MRSALGKVSTLAPDQGIEDRHDMIAGKRDIVADPGLLQRHRQISPRVVPCLLPPVAFSRPWAGQAVQSP